MPKTLLLADDSVTVQRVVELTFAHEDIRVVSVSDGRRAVQALDADGADLVLVDVEVPEIDGYGVAEHVRKSDRLRDTPVLLMAGALAPVDEARARELGCAGVLTKPFEPQVLVKRVKDLLSGTAGKPAGASLRPARYRSPEPLEPSRRPVWDASSQPHSAPRAAPAAADQSAPAAADTHKRSLVEAFSALLGADGAKAQPSAAPAPAPAPTTAELDEAVRRVLGNMTAESVRQIVAETAERLVREEIERIKADSE
jgi:DNA-binding response OmpR family regulator